MIREQPRSTLERSSAASEVYRRQDDGVAGGEQGVGLAGEGVVGVDGLQPEAGLALSLIHIFEPTRPYQISYAVFRLKKKNNTRHRAFHFCLTLPFYSTFITHHSSL